MIDLERAFSEEMLAEQETIAQAGPEKIAVLEAMKKGFYADMHRRMEQFFAHSHQVSMRTGI